MKLIQRYPALRKASLKGLQAFESAYLHKNFATAAKELSVTASAVSYAILSLESVLGVHLFDRGKKGATPTEAGNRLYAAIKRSFLEIDHEMQSIIDHPAKQQLVTLQCSPSFAHLWVLPRLPNFIRQHPEIDLRLWALHDTPDFGNNSLDIAISYGRLSASPRIVSEPLMPLESYVPMCSPELAASGSLKPSQLSEMWLIHNETSLVSWEDWIKAYCPENELINRGLFLDRSFMGLRAATEGVGVFLDSTLLAYDFLQDGSLVLPFGELTLPICAHHLCVLKQKLEQPKIQKLLKWIRSWLPQ